MENYNNLTQEEFNHAFLDLCKRGNSQNGGNVHHIQSMLSSPLLKYKPDLMMNNGSPLQYLFEKCTLIEYQVLIKWLFKNEDYPSAIGNINTALMYALKCKEFEFAHYLITSTELKK